MPADPRLREISEIHVLLNWLQRCDSKRRDREFGRCRRAIETREVWSTLDAGAAGISGECLSAMGGK